MVSIRQTAKKYHGRKAETYDEVREKQARWGWENEHVARMLDASAPRYDTILDCPVGTGRFIQTYANMGVRVLQGLDISTEMLALARKKVPRKMLMYATVDLRVGDASKMDLPDASHDVAVCVRFLDLIDEAAMVAVVKELCRVARRAVILTIRLGNKYVPKSNTSEHDTKKFHALVKKLGWKVEESVLFRDAGWYIMKLERVK